MLTNRSAKPPLTLPSLEGKSGPYIRKFPMSRYPYSPRLFADAYTIMRVGEGLLARSLPREEWTHEAHLAATCWLIRCRADIALETELPDIIRQYNVAVGGVNDDSQGYHETLTQLYVAGVRAHVEEWGAGEPLAACVNHLLESARGQRDWPLHFYSRERLFSVMARRYFVAPDLCAFMDAGIGRTCRPRLVPMDMEGQTHGNA